MIAPPPMPQPRYVRLDPKFRWPDMYDADQLTALDAQWQRIAEEAVAAAYEACALLCDLQAKIAGDSWAMTADPSEQGAEAAAKMLAAAMRARARAKEQANQASTERTA